jgi:hypothetical protein
LGDFTQIRQPLLESGYVIEPDSYGRPSVFVNLENSRKLVPLIRLLISLDVAFCYDYKQRSPEDMVALLIDTGEIAGPFLVTSFDGSMWTTELSAGHTS